MEHTRLNAYRIMWLFVFFDLPVVKKRDRQRATRFRKSLLDDGFTMMQYSVYIRHCASKESLNVHLRRVELNIPPKGYVNILSITDKQYGNIINFWGISEEKPLAKVPKQLELF